MSDVDTETLAEAVVEELDPGQIIDNKVILSRRQLVAIAGSGLSAGALAALGLEEASAQTGPAGQQGTDSEPNDMFAWDLDVANEVTSDLPMGGNDVTNVGALDADQTNTDAIREKSDFASGSTLQFIEAVNSGGTDGLRVSTQYTADVSTSAKAILSESAERGGIGALVTGRNGSNRFVDFVLVTLNGGGASSIGSETQESPTSRSYNWNQLSDELELTMGGDTYQVTTAALIAVNAV